MMEGYLLYCLMVPQGAGTIRTSPVVGVTSLGIRKSFGDVEQCSTPSGVPNGEVPDTLWGVRYLIVQ